MSTGKVCLCFMLAAARLLAVDDATLKSWTELVRQTDAMHRQGRLAEAAESGQRMLVLAKNFGKSDPRLSASYYILGSVYRSWGRCAESRANYAHAVALFEKQTDAKPRYVFNALVGLIGEASECDDTDAARKLYRAHAAGLQRYRSTQQDDAKVLALQAGIARGRKHYAEAEGYYRRAIQILDQTPGSPPADMAELRSSLAVMLSVQGRHQESLTQSERSIALLESVSPRYITLPAALNNAACTLAELGRRDESERTYQRALELARELYGESSRNTAKIMLNYAALLRDKKESPAAEALQKKGVDAYRRSLRHDSQTVDVEELKGR